MAKNDLHQYNAVYQTKDNKLLVGTEMTFHRHGLR